MPDANFMKKHGVAQSKEYNNIYDQSVSLVLQDDSIDEQDNKFFKNNLAGKGKDSLDAKRRRHSDESLNLDNQATQVTVEGAEKVNPAQSHYMEAIAGTQNHASFGRVGSNGNIPGEISSSQKNSIKKKNRNSKPVVPEQ